MESVKHFCKNVEEIDQYIEKLVREIIPQEDYFKISKLRFTPTDPPDLHDIVFILDKPSSTSRFGIGRISGWDESSDGEKRIFHVEMSRPSVKSHPYPL